MKPFAEARLYGIVDLGYVPVAGAPAAAERLIAGGADVIQLRAKNFDIAQIGALASAIHVLTSAAGIPLIINDHPQLLRDVPAEGVHVGQDDMSVDAARAAAGRECIVGKSTHSLEQAKAAAAEGADYIGFGPLFATPTKPGRPAIGLRDIAKVHTAVNVPIFCIGGIKLSNLAEVLAAGAKRIVIVSGWLQATDISDAVRTAAGILEKKAWVRGRIKVARGGRNPW